jgi:predicted neuraminidase
MNKGKGFTFTKETTRKDISQQLRQYSKLTNQFGTKNININDINFNISESYLENSYREQYHSCCLIQLDTILVLVWFAGNYEGYFNHIKLCYYNKNISKWSQPQIICQIHYKSLQNPVIFYHQSTQRLFLFASAFPSKKGQHRSIILYQSAYLKNISFNVLDNLIWTVSKQLYYMEGLLTKHKPIEINNNLYVLPVYHSNKNNQKDFSGLLWCHVNNDVIKSKFCPIPKTTTLVQPCIVQINNLYYTFFRTRKKLKSKLSYMIGCQQLMKYSYPEIDTPIVNNNSGIDVLYLNNNKLLIVFNESTKFSDRHRLSLAISSDLGKTVTKIINIEPSFTLDQYMNEDKQKSTIWEKAEFSYPSIIKNNDTVYISYTFNRETIKTVSFSLTQLFEMV